jgi:hypothetical protein
VHYLTGVRIDESVPQPSGAELDAAMARIGTFNDEMKAAGVVP